MKNILLILLLFASVSFSQILQKQEFIHPGKCFCVNSIDSVTYLFMESGIVVLGNSQFPSHRFISKYTGFTAKPGLKSAIIQNYMIVYQSDTLYYFDISNLFHPVLINAWSLTSPLTNLYPFGNYFILRSGNILDLYSSESDSLSHIMTIPFDHPQSKINYPYVILPYGSSIEFYKFSLSGTFFLYNTLSTPNLWTIAAGQDIFYYYTEKSNGPSFPTTRINFLDLAVDNFPVLYSYSNLNYTGNGSAYRTKSLTRSFWGTENHGSEKIIYTLPGALYHTYPSPFTLHLDRHLHYAFSTTNSDTLYFGTELFRFKPIWKYFSFPKSDQIIFYDGYYLNTMNNNPDNILEGVDFTALTGTLIRGKSYFLLRQTDIYQKYIFQGDSLRSLGYYTLQSVYNTIFDLGNYVVTGESGSFAVYNKANNPASKIFESPLYKKVQDAELSGNNLFLLDSANVIVKYQVSGSTVTPQWTLPSRYKKNFNFALRDSFLLVQDSKTLYLLNINTSISSPSIIDSLVMNDCMVYSSLEAHTNYFYLKEWGDSGSAVTRVEVVNNKIILPYKINLPFNSAFELSARGKKLIVFSPENIYWYIDTTVVSDIEFSAPDVPANAELLQNHPNPFNPSTTIRYSIPASGLVTIKLFDILGNEIASLVNEEKPAGNYEIKFNAAKLSSGVYFYCLQAGSFVKTKKMILMK